MNYKLWSCISGTDHWWRILDLVCLCPHGRGYRSSLVAFLHVATAFDYFIDWNLGNIYFLLSTQGVVVCILFVMTIWDVDGLRLRTEVYISHCVRWDCILMIRIISNDSRLIVKFDKFPRLWALTPQSNRRWLVMSIHLLISSFLSLTAISWRVERIHFPYRWLLFIEQVVSPGGIKIFPLFVLCEVRTIQQHCWVI